MTPKHWAATTPAALVLSLILSACGGGAGSDTTNTKAINANTTDGTTTTVAGITKANYSEVASQTIRKLRRLQSTRSANC
jgi:hypothetical protein